MTSQSARATQISRVAFVVPDATAVRYEYNALASAIRTKGDQVRCYSPNISRDDAAALDKQGIFCTEFSLAPDGFALFPERKAISNLANLISEWKPTTLIAIGGTTLVHGIRAAKKAGVAQIIGVVETWPAPSAETSQTDTSRPMAGPFKNALKSADTIIVLNADAPANLQSDDLVDENTVLRVTPRCGVDITEYGETPLPPLNDGFVFHLSCPLENENGVLAYCEAAMSVKSESPGSEFILTGPPGTEHPITLDALEPYGDAVTYAGVRLASKDDLARCHVFVCLSRLEAMPLTAMQALALGRPLIAADCAANRELVDERVNGCLVDPEDPSAIADALRSYLRRPDLIPSMARASRQKALRRLNQTDVITNLIPLLSPTG